MDHKTIALQAGALTVGDRQVRRLALIYSGVAFGVSLLLTVINFLLARAMDSTGGLAGMGSRALLSTGQAVLTILITVAMPFWDMGFYGACLGIAKQEHVPDSRLLMGFHRFWQVLALLLKKTLFFLLLGMIGFYAGTAVYMFLPLSDGMLEALDPLILQMEAGEVNVDMSVLTPYLIPMYIIASVVALACMTPAFYRLRLAEWYLMDKPLTAKSALAASARTMKGKRWNLFLVDLQYWWYFALLAVAMAVAYADLLLPVMGVQMNPDLASFLTYLVSLLMQFILSVFVTPRVLVAYAVFYHERKGQA